MGDKHEKICRVLRERYSQSGFKEGKSPFSTFYPDYYGHKKMVNGKLVEQVVVEVEIENTLFKHHTYQQLEIMGQFLGEQKRKKRKAHGLLAVPDSVNMKVQAEM